MSKIKYLTSYQGPSYGGLDQEFMDGEQSLYSAQVSFRRRNVMGYDFVNTYRQNSDGAYVQWETDHKVGFPATTEIDYMDVYHAVFMEGVYVLGEWAYRLTMGPRDGVQTKKCS